MKRFINFVFAIIATIMIAGCAKTVLDTTIVVVGQGGVPTYSYTVPQNSNGEYGIIFGNYSPYTKATSEGGVLVGPAQCGYDAFNMYAWKDGVDVMNPYEVRWDGSAWAYDNIAGQQLQYFDRNSSQYDFIGVISNGNETSTHFNEVTVTGVPAFLDNSGELDTPDEILWTSAKVEKASYSSPVPLTFRHANAKMYIGFASDRNDTEVIDYTPYTPGTPGVDAWDETVDVTTYQMTATTVPAQGPAIADIGISDEDIAYINGKYTASKGFSNYATNNVINGPLDEDMYAYLSGKYPALASASLNNWANNVSNSNMRLVHIDKTGQYDTYVGVWVNVQNVNWTAGTTTQTVIHHDAVPAVPATGLEGVRVFSVSEDVDGKNIVTAHTTEATAVVTNACVLSKTDESSDVITFGKPSGAIAQFASEDAITWDGATKSPSVWYALPVENPDNGYVVKFSYTYNGVSYYDARVHIPFADSDFAQGVYYTYVIYITDKTNGTTDPSEAEGDKDEVDTDNVPITFTISVTEYSDAGIKKYTLGN